MAGTARSTIPTDANKYYIRQTNGGYSSCIQGKPTHPVLNVLSNCVGWACGFFNEFVGLGYEKYHLNCNAENFIERAIASGLSVVKTPVVGGILVWQKGATLSGSDGAGHVAGCFWVNDVDNPTQIKTSESGYGSSAFWISTRTNTNGHWGSGAGYTYRGCIVPPNYVKPSPTHTPSPEPTIDNTWPKTHLITASDTLSGIAKKYYGNGDKAHYQFIATANNIKNPNIIITGRKITIPKYSEISNTTNSDKSTLKIGDSVKIIANGNGSSYGNSNIAGGIGLDRKILNYYEGRPYPYQVGNNSGTTGFYKAAALKKL